MKPFFDRGQFVDLPSPQTSSPRFTPDKSGYGVELRSGRDVYKRNRSLFISSGKWAEMADDGLIDQEIRPSVIGELIDTLNITPFSDQNERKIASQVLESGEIIQSETIDFDSQTDKDGRITVFNMRPRGYVANEEIPQRTRGVKVENYSIQGYSIGKSQHPFFDGGGSNLGILKEGFYGKSPQVTMTFIDNVEQGDIITEYQYGDFQKNIQQGSHGFSLYSDEFGTDSIAFAGLLK